MCHAEAYGLFDDICASPESLVFVIYNKLSINLHDFIVDTLSGSTKMEVFIVHVDFGCQCGLNFMISLTLKL
jgi:hypothetical protein